MSFIYIFNYYINLLSEIMYTGLVLSALQVVCRCEHLHFILVVVLEGGELLSHRLELGLVVLVEMVLLVIYIY
jgi:hypothetical protein